MPQSSSILINPSHLHHRTAVSHSLPKFAILKIEMGEADISGLAPLFFDNPTGYTHQRLWFEPLTLFTHLPITHLPNDL
jgi:hypothetical protein